MHLASGRTSPRRRYRHHSILRAEDPRGGTWRGSGGSVLEMAPQLEGSGRYSFDGATGMAQSESTLSARSLSASHKVQLAHSRFRPDCDIKLGGAPKHCAAPNPGSS